MVGQELDEVAGVHVEHRGVTRDPFAKDAAVADHLRAIFIEDDESKFLRAKQRFLGNGEYETVAPVAVTGIAYVEALLLGDPLGGEQIVEIEAHREAPREFAPIGSPSLHVAGAYPVEIADIGCRRLRCRLGFGEQHRRRECFIHGGLVAAAPNPPKDVLQAAAPRSPSPRIAASRFA